LYYYFGLASNVKDLTGWLFWGIGRPSFCWRPFIRLSLTPINGIIESPSLLLFFGEANPTGATNTVSGVLITVANRGLLSSGFCTLSSTTTRRMQARV
jgi:hypothetical protein